MTQSTTQTAQLPSKQYIAAQLQAARLFKGIPAHELEALIDVMQHKAFAKGELLFRKGDVGDSMFLILSGRVRIFTYDADHNEIDLAYLEPTRIFGDFVIFDQKPRSASALTVAPTECLILQRAAFEAFLPQHTFVGIVMMRNIAEQVRRVTSFLSQVNNTLDLITDGNFDLALQQLAQITSDEEALQTLIHTFTQMIHRIQQREAKLKSGTA
ncbi:MAG: cyclic nucleotide-binding domain-containing protein [Aggregatilineales bacterium]